MKKTILTLMLIGGSYMLFAQDETRDSTNRNTTNTYDSSRTMNSTNMNNGTQTPVNSNIGDSLNKNSSMSSNNAYNAYGATSVNIPSRAQMNLQKDYPTANNITWTQSGDWYHGTYLNNGRYSHIYYDDRGNTYSVSMPVTETYVPDDIMNRVTTMFGPMVYDVTTLKGDSSHHNIYQIRTLENGQVKTQWIGDDGSSIMDPFRAETSADMNTNTNSNLQNNNSNTSNNTDSTSSMNNSKGNMNTNTNSNLQNNNSSGTKDSASNKSTTDSTSSMNNNNGNMNASGNTTTSGNLNTTDSTAPASGMNNSGTTIKLKSKTSDGKETKTKIKNGEMQKKDQQ
jgi:hypothetical protein